jgi:exonuclease SbcD
MKILHTSDWHLGRSLYGRNRYAEYDSFLNWLATTLDKEDIDVLLIAGDVFDSTIPGNRAQELYYRFLNRVSLSACRHIVVVAGNHDSASFLNAPKELLRVLNVHVIGSRTEDPEDEVIVVTKEADDRDRAGCIIICAVPYLRDKDIRIATPGEMIDDKNRKLIEGISNHYQEVVAVAEERRSRLCGKSQSEDPQAGIPIVATGHLFAAGGKTVDGDGVRDLYIGSLVRLGADMFPPALDYVALGHLHIPQRVGGSEHIRYCGAPLPMGFGEANKEKIVVIAEFSPGGRRIRELPVPCFQELIRIEGPLDMILEQIEELKDKQSRAWLEINYSGREIISNLRERIEKAVAGSAMEVRRIGNRRLSEGIIKPAIDAEALEELDVVDVFKRCLEAFDVPAEERKALLECYEEVLTALYEDDRNEL